MIRRFQPLAMLIRAFRHFPGRRARGQLQPGHPPHPLGELFLLPRLRQGQARGRPPAGHEAGAKESAIVAGDAAASELFKRITASDPDDVMPPADSVYKLKPEQVETLRLWIEQGAKYEEHWAYKKLERPPVPEEGAASPIDSFLRQTWKEHGVSPGCGGGAARPDPPPELRSPWLAAHAGGGCRFRERPLAREVTRNLLGTGRNRPNTPSTRGFDGSIWCAGRIPRAWSATNRSRPDITGSM